VRDSLLKPFLLHKGGLSGQVMEVTCVIEVKSLPIPVDQVTVGETITSDAVKLLLSRFRLSQKFSSEVWVQIV